MHPTSCDGQASERELPHLESRPHLAIPCRVDPMGRTGPTKAETRGPHWRRTSRGRYVYGAAPPSTEQRILDAACVLPAYGGVTGWAALHWQHATRWFDGTRPDGTERPVWLATAGDDIRPQPGIRVSGERLDPRDLVAVDGVRLTSPVRSVCFEMRYAASVFAAARTLTMAAYYDLVSVAEVTQYAGRHSGWTGIPRCRKALPWAEENCWSPEEFTMVWVWQIEAGLARPLCNRPVFDRQGRHIGTPDLLDVEAGVVGQYDGRSHLRDAQRAVDVRAEERYRSLGLECFTMLASDRGDTAAMAERMCAARRRALWQAESVRAWTVEPPPWWVPTHTVELRRALDVQQRERLLRYRAAA